MAEKLLMILIMMGLGFLCTRRILATLKQKTAFALMRFVTKISYLHFRSRILKLNGFVTRNWWKQVTLCVYLRLTDLCFTKQKNKKKFFCKSCLQCFISINVLTEHRNVCLSINGAKSVKLEKGTIEFKKYFK